MRQRYALYLSQAMTKRLQVMAETHRVAKSEILERALKRYLADESGGPPADLLALQQESNTRALRRLERDLAIAAELIATFVRYFLTITPPLPGREHAAARALGQQRAARPRWPVALLVLPPKWASLAIARRTPV